MSFWDTLKELFGGAADDVQQNVQDNPVVSDVGQKAQDAAQNVGQAAEDAKTEVGQKVEEVKKKLNQQ